MKFHKVKPPTEEEFLEFVKSALEFAKVAKVKTFKIIDTEPIDINYKGTAEDIKTYTGQGFTRKRVPYAH